MQTILIVAVSDDNVIGEKGKLPWKLPRDLQHFKETTSGHSVIMGRKTWESLDRIELLHRHNIVVSSKRVHPNIHTVPSLAQAIVAAHRYGSERAFIIGGAEIYKAALPICDEAIVTRVHGKFPRGDAFFNYSKLKEHMTLYTQESREKDAHNPYDLTFERWVRA